MKERKVLLSLIKENHGENREIKEGRRNQREANK